MLKGINVVVGVCGGIAAYKVVDVVSRLKKQGAEVNVIMTKNAQAFVTPLTFQSLSHNYVVTDMFDEPKTWDVEHIELAKKADIFLIAPASANFIGKLANGIADDMLTTTVMATLGKTIIAPAMNTNMYLNPIVQENISYLKDKGYMFIEPETGKLACEDVGIGKLASPEIIVDEILKTAVHNKDLKGKKIIISAGPTQEAIDPVRYITNHSSGKMGYALAKAALDRGADVILVSGKTNLEPPLGVDFIPVVSSDEMYEAIMSRFEQCDIIIKAAAVADYRPKIKEKQKVKKTDDDLVIELTRNKDIAMEIGAVKGDRILVGFAAETNDVLDNAIGKIKKKNLDMIVANDLTVEGAGFGTNTNIVTIIDKFGNVYKLDKMTKDEVADEIINRILDFV